MSAVPAIPLVDVAAQYRAIGPQIAAAIEDVLKKGEAILGPAVSHFEDEFAAYLGIAHAVGVGSGLDALRLSLMALDIGSGHEVIIPANTYIATALAVSSVGAKPVLVDCHSETAAIDASQIEAAITPRTKAVIPVHLYGRPMDQRELLCIAQRRSLAVIEDAAQAHGASFNGRFCGTFGDLGCFSFYPSKNLGAYGDGGMVVTSHGHLAERIRILRNYGQQAKNVHTVQGLNSRLDTVQAAVLRVKLRHLDRWNQQRAVHAARYRELLSSSCVGVDQSPPGTTHVYHLFVVRCSNRDRLQAHLKHHGIETGIHYPCPIHLQPAYASLALSRGTFPVAERLSSEILSLPMYPELTEDQVQRVARTVQAFFQS